jgi:nucleoside-diphosphate-sugar epimerase
MRVFVAGAAGAIGRQLISLLVGAGHDVTGTTRSTERAEWLASAGARPIIVDAYDRDALRAAVADARPDVVVHELTDFARGFDAENLASNGRLREVGTRNLVDGAVAAGAGRLVAPRAGPGSMPTARCRTTNRIRFAIRPTPRMREGSSSSSAS